MNSSEQQWCIRIRASSTVDRGFELRVGQIKVKLVCVASLLSMHHSRVRANTGVHGIRTICPSDMIHLPMDCRFSVIEFKGTFQQ